MWGWGDIKFCSCCKLHSVRKDNKKLCNNCYSDKVATIIALILVSLLILGNIVMLVCGALGTAGILNINLAVSISMIVIGSIFGALPLLKNIFRGK